MLNTYSIPPAPSVPTLFWIFVSPSPRTYLISLPHINPVGAAYLSLFTRFFPPPISPGRRATFHLDGAPTCRPPPLVCTSLPCRASQGVTRASLWLPPLVRLPPPLQSFTCSHFPVSSRYSPVRGSLPPSACLHHPHAHSRPYRPSTAAQSPAGPEWLASCSSVCLSLVLPPLHPHVQLRLLVSSGFWFTFSGVFLL